MKIRPVRADRRTDRQTNKFGESDHRFWQFCERALQQRGFNRLHCYSIHRTVREYFSVECTVG